MSSPATLPLSFVVGDTWSIPVTIQDGDGNAINISGRTYAAQIRATADASTTIATFTCTLVGTGSTGEFVCTIPALTTASIAPGVGVYDLEETNGTIKTTLISGPVSIVQDVTR